MYKLKEVLVICKKKGEILLHWNSSLLIVYECKYKRGVGSRGLSLRHSYCLGTYSRYKDSTRPPPYSTQDEATEGCSAVWDHSNKLLPQSGPDEAFFFPFIFTVFTRRLYKSGLSELLLGFGLEWILPVFACQRLLSESPPASKRRFS